MVINIGHINEKQDKIGKRFVSSNGYWAKCIAYNNAHDIIVEFEEYPIRLHTQWNLFKRNRFKFPIGKYGNINDVGCLDENKNVAKEYSAWNSIFKRCYSSSTNKNRPTYNNKEVCKEWVIYSNFLKWIQSQENYERWLKNDGWCIDKDILQKGNTIYESNKCLLVPEYVNCLFVKCDSHRGKYPIGVYYDKASGKYKSQCQNPIEKKYKNLGRFDTVEDAFNCYKEYKEKMIKRVAKEEYEKGNITKECYFAMMNYQVEITD